LLCAKKRWLLIRKRIWLILALLLVMLRQKPRVLLLLALLLVMSQQKPRVLFTSAQAISAAPEGTETPEENEHRARCGARLQ
jgi:hypothetical protein